MKASFLKTNKTTIVDASGKPVLLHGINFGGWLMMEGYFMGAPNKAEQVFKKNFAQELGAKALEEFEFEFRKAFILEQDFKNVAAWGMNVIRLPFNYRLIETSLYQYSASGLAYLDEAVRLAKKHGLWVILDLHAAPGAQNHDWHSDSLGQADLWTNSENQKRTIALWEYLGDHFKDEPAVAGYDLLNEPVLEDMALLNRFYKELIGKIRAIDQKHILFVEGSRWSQDIDILEDFNDDNLCLSIHYYGALEFSFNFIPGLRYPLKSKAGTWDKGAIRQFLSGYAKTAKRRQCPIFVGEWGTHSRGGAYGEDKSIEDILGCFDEFGFHRAYWTYKAIKNHMFPDGVFSYYPNSPWVNRPGPKSGWDTWASLWPTKKNEMIRSWSTKAFDVNQEIEKVLIS
ncbi:MAG: glycoside hydrolase family 5 protein [Candidatus Omnitrophica bacterium]|nr:glycoside hydrolase family 5 protein [Candidatus Omnitrophota bacterium]